MSHKTQRLRCAIYTRKSHDEGLEQAFNSLDAQREAALAYIQSQRHEGWEALPESFDDGGYSGGSMERPGLKRLLEAIQQGRVDGVVVYKVDRLSRSLHDFAQMMHVFDEHKVCFVSVTQPFNTTTSMGRLTLNVLLSFAQFEREVTGERIRDKIAASKRKGMWMGGVPPLGYRVADRQLVIDDEERVLVERMFNEYRNKRSLLGLARLLNDEGYTTKRWQSQSGVWHGGKALTPKYLYRVLTNPVYIGKIVHREGVFDGQHTPIIERQIWDDMVSVIKQETPSGKHQHKAFYLLKGKLHTHEGFAMSPSSTMRSRRRLLHQNIQERVLYYVSQKAISQGYRNCAIKTLNAALIDNFVAEQVMHYLKVNSIERQEALASLIERVVVGPDHLIITLDEKRVHDWQVNSGNLHQTTARSVMIKTLHQPDIKIVQGKIVMTLKVRIKRVNGTQRLLTAEGDDLVLPTLPVPAAAMVQAIGRAWRWREMLDEDAALTIKALAKQCGFTDRYISRHLALVGLAPDILHRALTGTLPPQITLERLEEAAQSFSWEEQRQWIGVKG